MGLELPLVLGTSSVFRREQMERLGIAFQAASPDFDETPMLGESAPQTALRLAEGKARSLAGRFPGGVDCRCGPGGVVRRQAVGQADEPCQRAKDVDAFERQGD